MAAGALHGGDRYDRLVNPGSGKTDGYARHPGSIKRESGYLSFEMRDAETQRKLDGLPGGHRTGPYRIRFRRWSEALGAARVVAPQPGPAEG